MPSSVKWAHRHRKARPKAELTQSTCLIHIGCSGEKLRRGCDGGREELAGLPRGSFGNWRCQGGPVPEELLGALQPLTSRERSSSHQVHGKPSCAFCPTGAWGDPLGEHEFQWSGNTALGESKPSPGTRGRKRGTQRSEDGAPSRCPHLPRPRSSWRSAGASRSSRMSLITCSGS